MRRNRLGNISAVFQASAAMVEEAPMAAVTTVSRTNPISRLTIVRAEKTMEDRIMPPRAPCGAVACANAWALGSSAKGASVAGASTASDRSGDEGGGSGVSAVTWLA
jgi:hypothetical protein